MILRMASLRRSPHSHDISDPANRRPQTTVQSTQTSLDLIRQALIFRYGGRRRGACEIVEHSEGIGLVSGRVDLIKSGV
jgi:hypothetical protein